MNEVTVIQATPREAGEKIPTRGEFYAAFSAFSAKITEANAIIKRRHPNAGQLDARSLWRGLLPLT